jgi:hypothetical protein
MVVSLKHKFASAKSDGVDTTLVRPSNWNDDHDLTLAASKLLGRATASAGAAEEVTVGTSLSLDAASQTLRRAALTGDVTASVDSNATTIATDAVTTAKIAAGAATLAKLDRTGTSGQVLTAQGSGVAPIWAAASGAATGTLLRAPQILTTGTSYTTPAGCNTIYIELVGAGAGGQSGSTGANGGGGGGAGSYAAKYFTVSPSTSYTYAIGAAGGATGGNTTFAVGATTVTAGGGSRPTTTAGGVGGTATNGDLNVRGGHGGPASTASQSAGGSGGASFFGSGGAGGTASAGVTALVYGGGGGGGGFGNNSGGSGMAGVIRVWEYT